MKAAPSRSPTPLWDEMRLRDPHREADKAARVRAMFDAIAPTYERVNAVVSFGRDAAWRRAAVRLVETRPGAVVLDVCCGTGDMIREFARQQPRVGALIGVDFASRMLGLGRYANVRPAPWLCRADGQRLPFADGSIDVVSCAFGVRNFQVLATGLREMQRVLRPGGRAVILEFAEPDNALLRGLCGLYCNRVLPRVATLLSGDESGAYRYLPSSIRTFGRSGELVRRLEAAGLSRVVTRSMNLGSVVAYRADKGVA
jgi:demethylmenaquinone methyltransferase/2-methoxy-6-polyprenyl-1,4-benzoquinol methylase